jgi:pyruvate dehydrogenase E2 component (dihydrolipoamide acetyltransferase)
LTQHVFTSCTQLTQQIMAEAVVMPRQGQSVESCVITQWLKQKGEQVEEGDLLFSYETDKAAFDESAPVAGTLLEVLYGEGDEVPVLQTVAIIGEPGEDIAALLGGAATDAAGEPGGVAKDAAAAGEPGGAATDAVKGATEAGAAVAENTKAGVGTTGATAAEDATAVVGTAGAVTGTAAGGSKTEEPGGRGLVEENGAAAGSGKTASRTRISPRARNMAKAMQVDIASVRGTGPNGRIIADDIQAAVASGSREIIAGQVSSGTKTKPVATGETGSGQAATYAVPNEPFTDQPLSNIRKLIAKNMKASLDHSAQLTHHASADARKILSLRKAIKEGTVQQLPASTTLNDMVCHAIIRALKETPEMNAHFLGDKTRTFSGVHLGMAVDTPRGLMVPVLKNADRYTLGGLGQSLRELAENCKSGRIDPDLLAPEAGSFTVSNLGAFGIEMFTPVLNLPQSGIIGINTITYRPADMGDGNIGFIPHIGISLTYDHRAIDGAPASRFLQKVCRNIADFDPTY